MLRDVGTSIIGQTASLAPADKKLYALRDVTATVESIPLISASIMSKKLAEGSNALVLDVKCGDGAFMKTWPTRARWPSRWWRSARTPVFGPRPFITDMDAPLGRAVGNALEIIECLETLKGNGPADLTESSIRVLAARMVVLAGVGPRRGRGDPRVDEALVVRARAADVRAG